MQKVLSDTLRSICYRASEGSIEGQYFFCCRIYPSKCEISNALPNTLLRLLVYIFKGYIVKTKFPTGKYFHLSFWLQINHPVFCLQLAPSLLFTTGSHYFLSTSPPSMLSTMPHPPFWQSIGKIKSNAKCKVVSLKHQSYLDRA